MEIEEYMRDNPPDWLPERNGRKVKRWEYQDIGDVSLDISSGRGKRFLVIEYVDGEDEVLENPQAKEVWEQLKAQVDVSEDVPGFPYVWDYAMQIDRRWRR